MLPKEVSNLTYSAFRKGSFGLSTFFDETRHKGVQKKRAGHRMQTKKKRHTGTERHNPAICTKFLVLRKILLQV